MSQPYNAFQYIYPPRTKSVFPYEGSVLKMWKSFPDAVAQFKMNGNRNLIFVSPDRKVQMWNRHAEPQKYDIPDVLRNGILGFSPEGFWTVWDTELLETKTKKVKNVLYFFDVLVWKSEYLVGNTYGERLQIVHDAIGLRKLPLDFREIEKTGEIYTAYNIPPAEWDDAAKLIQINKPLTPDDHCEGLVYKRTGTISRLVPAVSKTDETWNNGGFMAKTRKPNKNSRA